VNSTERIFGKMTIRQIVIRRIFIAPRAPTNQLVSHRLYFGLQPSADFTKKFLVSVGM